MPAVRKAVLDAIRGAMRDPVYGFNARFASVCAGYGLEPVEIDWSEESRNVFYGSVTSTDKTGLSGRLAVILGTGASIWTGRTKGVKWSGDVQAVLIFIVTYDHDESESDGIEEYDIIERWVGAVEDVVIEIFAWAENYYDLTLCPAGRPSIPNLPPPELLEDGWRQEIPIHQVFHVDMI